VATLFNQVTELSDSSPEVGKFKGDLDSQDSSEEDEHIKSLLSQKQHL